MPPCPAQPCRAARRLLLRHPRQPGDLRHDQESFVSTLRIRLFGSLDLERGGQPLERLPSRKARDLFAYLALQRQSNHAREQLAGVFWGDSDEDKARQALNTTLWRIH